MFIQRDRLGTLLRRSAVPFTAWILAHVLLLLPVPQWAQGGAALVLCLFPGALLALLLFADERDPFAKAWMAVCGSLAFIPPFMLLLHIIPGPLSMWMVLIPAGLLTLLHGWLLLQHTGSAPALDAQSLTTNCQRSESARLLSTIFAPRYLIILVLLLGTAFRAPYLGSSEIQGDESLVLMLANGIVHGRDDILMAHKKGPVEVLLPSTSFTMTGRISEGVARLPFLLAGIGIMLGAFVIGRALFAKDEADANADLVGLLAATIVALDGFLIGFARIVQYQSIVVLMTSAALWCAWRFATNTLYPRRMLLCAAVFAAIALLTHWDAIFVLPVLAWLVFAGARQRGWSVGQATRTLALPVLVGAVLMASFYIPFVTNEHFQRTLGYLLLRVKYKSGNVFPFNNLLTYYDTATFYNTIFQMRTYGVILAFGIITWLWRYSRPLWLGSAVALVFIVGVALLILAPHALQLPGGGNLMFLAVAFPLAVLICLPATPLALRTVLLWFSVPLCMEAFAISFPNTHFYSMDTPGALLIALAVARLWAWLQNRHVRWLQAPLALAGCALLLLAAPYMYIAFVRQSPPFSLAFPQGRPEIYRAGYGDTKPITGKFGFPHRSGWKTIGTLYEQGILKGSYVTNEEEKISGWYVHGAYNCTDNPDYYFIATTPNDAVKMSQSQIKKYHLLGSVLVDGKSAIKIYSRSKVAKPQNFDADIYGQLFDDQPVPEFPLSRPLRDFVPQYVFDARWPYGLRMHGYDLDTAMVTPSQRATVTFYWEIQESLERDYEVVLQVLNHDGTPVKDVVQSYCHKVPPIEWNSDKVNMSSFQIKSGKQMPPGTYTLQLGLRDRKTKQWVSLANGTQMLPVRSIEVKAK